MGSHDSREKTKASKGEEDPRHKEEQETLEVLRFSRNRCLVVAEVGQAHDGSLNQAHAFIDAIANAGANAVKFQTHIAAAESTPEEPWRVKLGWQDATRYDYWKRIEFTEEQWRGLKTHAAERGLFFLSSPFSLEAVELLNRIGVSAWKVASGEVSNPVLLKAMAASGLPMILSSGMSFLNELDHAVGVVQSRKIPLAVLQCTSAYPCPPEKIGLNLLHGFRRRYRCYVGLSDHSGTIWPSLTAAALGADLVEVHVTFSRDMFSPDGAASITMAELQQLVSGIQFIEKMHNNPIKKDEIAKETQSIRRIFSKSIVAKRDLEAGTILTEVDLTLKKPGTGIPATEWSKVIGKRLKKTVRADEILTEDDLED